jgi:hypothetical protein
MLVIHNFEKIKNLKTALWEVVDATLSEKSYRIYLNRIPNHDPNLLFIFYIKRIPIFIGYPLALASGERECRIITPTSSLFSSIDMNEFKTPENLLSTIIKKIEQCKQ